MILFDIAYIAGLAATSPYWLLRCGARRKVLSALHDRTGRNIGFSQSTSGPCIMIHAVSVGELNATPLLVKRLLHDRPDLTILLTTTTATGWDRAAQLYGQHPNVRVARFPLDLSRPIRRLLNAARPSVVALMELEVWPNFMAECARRRLPVAIINGRLTESSFSGYRRVRPFMQWMFRALSRVCAQDELYASRFRDLGVPADRVTVTGTMKFDTAEVGDAVAGDAQLAAEVGLDSLNSSIWVCGSTGPGEEAIILRAYTVLRRRHAGLRLVIVPRKPERFDEVAQQIEQAGFPLVRRSKPDQRPKAEDAPPVVLGDTMGELRKFYSLASVVFVGRSLVDLGPRQHGSDMIEPAALARAIVTGPFTHNFADAMRRFAEADAIRVVEDEQQLIAETDRLLAAAEESKAMGERAQRVVRAQQGATARHAAILLELLSNTDPASPAVTSTSA